jgi:hypothetical protein
MVSVEDPFSHDGIRSGDGNWRQTRAIVLIVRKRSRLTVSQGAAVAIRMPTVSALKSSSLVNHPNRVVLLVGNRQDEAENTMCGLRHLGRPLAAYAGHR